MTVAAVVAAVRGDPAWSVHELTLPDRVAVIAIQHHLAGTAYHEITIGKR